MDDSSMAATPKTLLVLGSHGQLWAWMQGKVRPSSIDAHKRGGALLVMGATPALAKGTVSFEPAGEAEKITAAKPEALVS